ncbi:probable inactive receptor kinase At5g67200 [Mangifera indica]|uniref:probable inactive receptor kinase At5g67200 n=1 Tax=Mangifera indica TaxID=29780 RepID=UPI001CFA771E|nr:probable inactive receptor kinase At5g67200 [Mangifera indica]
MSMRSKQSQQKKLSFLSNALVLLSFCSAACSIHAANLLLPSDAKSLLAFKSTADLRNSLSFSQNSTLPFCLWQGVICYQQKVVRLVLESLDLGGVFPPDSLSKLDQLRVLSLQNNSLTGPIPDLSRLINLKSLFLDHNFFTGTFPPSISFLYRLKTLDLSRNNLTGQIPKGLTSLDRLYSLRLDLNRLNGSIPPLNQSSLQTFNVSGNNLTGAIPVTSTLSRFGISSFLFNPGLCGEIIHKDCRPSPSFFGPSTAVTAAPPPAIVIGQTAQIRGVECTQSRPTKHKRTAVIIGFSTGVFVLIASLLCFVMAVKKQNQKNSSKSTAMMASDDAVATAQAAAMIQIEQENELEEKVKRVKGMQVAKSGNLVFCVGEAHLYTLDQLMRGSAELLGRGTMGTTYKAVLDNRLIVCVKRLDGSKLANTSKEMYEEHMESVGGLRHPNLVPLRAYFQAKEERLLIYDYQPNGSLFSLIHGSRSTRAKSLHWTSCLKIAEDVAQGLCYIHQAWRLVHGNLKSSNVLLGPDFEACLADYCLQALSNSTPEDDPANLPYKAPETRINASQQVTAKADVYAFGVLLVELLTGKPPSQHPSLMPDDMMNWVRSQREDESEENDRLGMLMEVAVGCILTSPEQRPTMWQVLKMLQQVKEAVLTEDGELDPQTTGMA